MITLTITSEQPPHDSRKFSLRSFDEEGDIDTVGQFCAYRSKADAMIALRSLPADRKEQAA